MELDWIIFFASLIMPYTFLWILTIFFSSFKEFINIIYVIAYFDKMALAKATKIVIQSI